MLAPPFPYTKPQLYAFSVIIIFSAMTFISFTLISKSPDDKRYISQVSYPAVKFNSTFPLVFNITELRTKWIQRKLDRIRKHMKDGNRPLNTSSQGYRVNYNAHIFYFSFFRNGQFDGKWKHWMEEDHIRTSFYPQLGLYSSRNLTVIDIHFGRIKKMGIGVVVVGWEPSGSDDSTDDIIPALFESALKYGLKICLNIRSNPFSLQDIKNHIRLIVSKYSNHKAYHRIQMGNKDLPVFYLHESFSLFGPGAWAQLLSPKGNMTVRGTRLDGVFLGLLADFKHRLDAKLSFFDGFYTYYPANGFTYGSTWKNWVSLAKFAKLSQLFFIPCVAPGFSEPGGFNNKPRHHGNYFEVGVRAAIGTRPSYIGITSFNNWEEGSQIEPAVPHQNEYFTYSDYKPHGPDYYSDLVGWWINWWSNKEKTR